MAVDGEIISAFPPPSERRPITRVRSTIVTSSIDGLRAHGQLDRWAQALTPKDRDALLTTIAGTWLPIALVMEHYRACESLRLTHEQAYAIGMSVGTRAHDSVLSLVKRLATGAGVTPWVLGPKYDRLWTRSYEGGGFEIRRAGPKDATLEVFDVPMAEFSYYRAAFCGVNVSGVGLLCQKAYARVVGAVRPGRFTVRISWV